MIAWLNRDFWGPVWPNLAASGICATAAVLRIRVHLARHHQALAREHDKTRRLIAGLHDRIDRLGAERKDAP